jgi:hypothetical protein
VGWGLGVPDGAAAQAEAPVGSKGKADEKKTYLKAGFGISTEVCSRWETEILA